MSVPRAPDGGGLLLILVCLRNVRHNLPRYLLASGGIGLAVLLASAALTGITVIRRVGVQPMREFIGGDIMVARGQLDLQVRSGGAYSDLSEFNPFDCGELTDRLAQLGYETTGTLFVPAYVYGPAGGGRLAALLGRSLGGAGPQLPIDDGRFLAPEDAGLPRLAGPALDYMRNAGQVVRIRVPRYRAAGAGPTAPQVVPDLPAGADYDFTVVGVSHRAIRNEAPVVPLDFLQAATGCGLVHWVGIAVEDYARLEQEAERVRAAAPGFTVLTSEDVLSLIDTESARLQAASLPMMLMVLGVGCIAVLNTAWLLTRLRRREVALMKVMGFSTAQTAAVFVIEALAATILGGVAGYVLGGLVGSGMGRFGLGLSVMSLSYVLGLVAAVTLVATVPPALWAARRSAMEVMRNA